MSSSSSYPAHDRSRDRDRDRARDYGGSDRRPPPDRENRDRRRPSPRRSNSRDRYEERRTARRSRSNSRHRDRHSRSRSRSESYDRERERRAKRRKKPSGWDVAPLPTQLPIVDGAVVAPTGAALTEALHGLVPGTNEAASASTSGFVHPSRMGLVPAGTPGATAAPMAAAMNPFANAAFAPTAAFNAMAGGFGAGAGAGVPNLQNPSMARQQRRLYVGNLPTPVRDMEIQLFFAEAMKKAYPDLPGESVTSVYLNMEKKFAFVEFRNPEEATMGLIFDGIAFRGQMLKVRRPSDYIPTPTAAPTIAPTSAPSIPFATVGTQVADGPNKIFCGGLPYNLLENEVKELVSSFGQLKSFHLVKDRDTNQSKGYCFFDYVDPSVTDIAVNGLNNIRIGDRTLTVRRAKPQAELSAAGIAGPGVNVAMLAAMNPALAGLMAGAGAGAAQMAGMHGMAGMAGMAGAGMPSMQAGAAYGSAGGSAFPSSQPKQPTRVLVMVNMVTPEELNDDQEYREIVEDVEFECRKYGQVQSVVIPRPNPTGAHVPGLGRVFVEFAHETQAAKARAELEGRQFAGRTVRCDYMPIEQYMARQFE